MDNRFMASAASSRESELADPALFAAQIPMDFPGLGLKRSCSVASSKSVHQGSLSAALSSTGAHTPHG